MCFFFRFVIDESFETFEILVHLHFTHLQIQFTCARTHTYMSQIYAYIYPYIFLFFVERYEKKNEKGSEKFDEIKKKRKRKREREREQTEDKPGRQVYVVCG